jgi:hypothetical protein
MVISPEKFETLAFLGQDPVRYKIVVGNKCLKKSQNFKYVGLKFPMKMEKIFDKNSLNLLKYCEL